MWCLDGKTVQGLKNPDITPWAGKGTTEVELTLFVDKTKHVIKRTVNPNKITIDGDECAQEHINKLIAIPFEIIPYTIILGQRQPLFFDLTASEKLKLFSEVLQLDRWEDRSAHAAELCKNLEKEIAAKEAELEGCLNSQTQALSDFNSLKLQSSAWETKRAEQLSNAEDDKKALQKQIESVSNERDTADLQLDRALTELKAIGPLVEQAQKQERIATITLASLKKDTLRLIEDNKELCEQLDALKNDKHCPTCKQTLTSPTIKKQIEDDTKSKITANDTKVTELRKLIDKTKKAQDKAVETIDAHSKAKRQFENDAEEARTILDRLLPRISKWDAEIKAIEKRLDEGANTSNPYTEQLQTLRRRRDRYKVSIKDTQESLKTKTEYCERAKFWVKGFKDIRLLVVEEVLQELELCTGSMLEEFGLVGWKITYDIERETKSGTVARGLNITVLSPSNKNAVKWESWSGGEAQRLRLVGTLALGNVLLNRVGMTTNFTAFDEPTESLSKEGVVDLVELLAQYANDAKRSVWLVDHHVISSAKFVKEITIVKDKLGSRIE